MHDQRHQNVLPLFCSFVSGDSLWMVMPFLSGGSVMKLLHSVAAEVSLLDSIMAHMGFSVRCLGISTVSHNPSCVFSIKVAGCICHPSSRLDQGCSNLAAVHLSYGLNIFEKGHKTASLVAGVLKESIPNAHD